MRSTSSRPLRGGRFREWSTAAPAALVIALCAGGRGLLASAYAVLATTAFRLYDVVYRQRLAGPDAPRDRLEVVGWPVRVLVVGVVAVVSRAGWDVGVARRTLLAAAALGAAVALVSDVRFWRARPQGATAP
jgi:hypothetical protein